MVEPHDDLVSPGAHGAAAPAEEHLAALAGVLGDLVPRIVACSGGVDSLLLATVAHRAAPERTVVGHSVTPAVPREATTRVRELARREGWRLEVVRSGEFDDERYLRNPGDRCYFCKSGLYDALGSLRRTIPMTGGAVVLSGANLDDLHDYRPGLVAAAEWGVRHPLVEAGMDKTAVRDVARLIGLAEAELPASPCLASRLYTGTRVTAPRLRAIELGEAIVRSAGVAVVRCRVREGRVLVEVGEEDRAVVTSGLLAEVARAMRAAEPGIGTVSLDPRPYRPGRAVLNVG